VWIGTSGKGDRIAAELKLIGGGGGGGGKGGRGLR